MPRKRRDKFHRRKQGGSHVSSEPVGTKASEERKESNGFFYNIYDKHYKTLLVIPVVMLLVALVLIGGKLAMTGEFLNKGVSLKGGITLTILSDDDVSASMLEDALRAEFPANDISVRSMERSGSQIGLLIEADIDGNDKASLDRVVGIAKQQSGTDDLEYSLEVMGSALGNSFFRQTFTAIIIAFVFMALVVWYYFRIPVPSGAVILAAFSDMVVTLAIVNIMGMRLSTAGIAAFLMLIGYSVDTDILLSTRVLKHTGGSVLDRTLSAMKTGLTMNMTTMAAVIVALIFSESEVLKQIMTILLIGLIVDIINTWLQNAGILRWYLESHKVDLKKLD